MSSPESIDVIVVTWNSHDTIVACLDSLFASAGISTTVWVVDNASTDGTAELVADRFPQVRLIRQTTNTGFASGNNRALREGTAPYVLLCNPDAVVAADAVARLHVHLRTRQDLGAVGPKLYRVEALTTDDNKRDILDSTGLTVRRWRAFADRDAGKPETHVRDRSGDVFGVSAACALYRRTALESIRGSHGVLDERFGSYKEDVDLAWRLQWAGWNAAYVAEAVAWHRRGVRPGSRARRSSRERFLSYRNHLLTLLKNDVNAPWFDRLLTASYECGKAVYALFREPYTLRSWTDILRILPTIRAERAHALRKRSPAELNQWFH